MALRVAFDLDGTVADMFTALRQEADALFGEQRTIHGAGSVPDPAASDENPVVSALQLSAREQVQLWDRVKHIENFWTTLPELEPGIIARIAKAATERRWEVIFLTTRPSSAGDTTQLQSQRWLRTHGFEFPSVFVVHGSRGKVADALGLDIVVDDRPENCLDVAVESKAKPILIWQGDPKVIPPGATRLGVKVAASISEAVALIERYDDLRRQPGMMKSLRRMLGKQQQV
ncbi:MAG: hypothetical protein AB1635_03670 [Acidobacteriota bacterium]